MTAVRIAAVLHAFGLGTSVIRRKPDMSCEDFLRIFRDNPSFDPVACGPLLRREIEHWRRNGAARPDYVCLEEAWEFGRKMSGGANPEALVSNVADQLRDAIVDGAIRAFDQLGPGIVDSHVLTSASPVSLMLCERLKTAKDFVVGSFGGGQGLLGTSRFVRQVVLGFGWNEEPIWGGSLAALANDSASKVTSAELLLAYRFASAIMADRKAAAQADPALRDSCDRMRGVCDGIAGYLRGSQFPAGDEESRKIVVKVIELQQFVQAMVDVLVLEGPARADAIARANAALDLGRPDGRISHLREYVALGTPLIDLVGQENQVDVRRDIERIMERIDQKTLPGFPHINSVGSSRRASELLRRLRFLVRAMVLESSKAGADPLFHRFRQSLFHGTGKDARLDAARIAFERPSRAAGWKRDDKGKDQYDKGEDPVYRDLRAKIQNLLAAHAFGKATVDEASGHSVVGALRGAVRIDVDSWSAASDGDSATLAEAVLDILDECDTIIKGIDEDGKESLISSVFDPGVITAGEASDCKPRRGFFEDVHQRLNPGEADGQQAEGEYEVLRRFIDDGLDSFREFVTANFHREFDRPKLHEISGWQVFERAENGEACRVWLQSWALVSKERFNSAGTLVGQATSSAQLQADAKAKPFESDPYSGGSLMFQYADAAAEGNLLAKTAIEQLVSNPVANRVLMEASEMDGVGRPVGLALAQGCSADSLEALYGPRRGFDLGFGASVDQVTPLMAAVRFAARRTEEEHEHRKRIEWVMHKDPTFAGGKDAHHDSRGWRAIHHAFAAGNLAAARLLFERDRSCITVQGKDKTTFLIEAIRQQQGAADAGEIFRAAWDMLKTLAPAEQAKVLAFQGPETPFGLRLSLVSAALCTSGRWAHLLEPLANDVHRESILSVVGTPELSYLLRGTSDQQFSLFCQQVALTADGKSRLRKHLSAIAPSPAMVAVGSIRDPSEAKGVGHAVRAISRTQRKLKDLHGYEALDLEKSDPFSRNNALHRLVERTKHSPHRDAMAGQLYELGWDMIQSASPERRVALVTKQNLEGETPIWLATRLGMHSLALAYSQFLGNALGTSDDVWLRAARVVRDPDRYQDGVDRDRRLFVDPSRRLSLGLGLDKDQSPRVLVLSSRPLPEDIHTRSARKWLIENATEIADSVRRHWGIDIDIPASAFANWLAHLAIETGDGMSSLNQAPPTRNEAQHTLPES